MCIVQRCQVSRFRREPPVFRRPLRQSPICSQKPTSDPLRTYVFKSVIYLLTYLLTYSHFRRVYLDVHYGSLLYGRTYLLFSPFTYSTSGSDRHTHAGEAAVLLLDRQAHHCLLIYVVLAQTRNARCFTIVNMANWSDKSEEIKK